jgi:hypothetical protein
MQFYTDIENELKNNFKNWKFNLVFKRKGIQAVCGTLKRQNTNDLLVYKVGIHPDRVNEHEVDVMLDMNSIKEYSKHFTYLYHHEYLPVMNSFISSNLKEKSKSSIDETLTLFSKSEDNLNSTNRLVLFMEYISNIHLKHALRSNDDSLSSCLLVMCLAAIQQGIDHCNFNHYDLHIDNVLLKECEQNAFFAYRFKDNKMLLTPTKGFYPVFIDYGTSYTNNYTNKGYSNNLCKTSIINACNGLQSTVFDSLTDVHQVILNSMFELEKCSDKFYYISSQIMNIFKYCKMTRELGWKLLPFDIFDCIINKILDYKPNIEDDYNIMEEKQSEIIDILTYTIELPFEQLDENKLQLIQQKYKPMKQNKIPLNMLFQKKCEYLLAESFDLWCKQVTEIQKSLIKNKYIKITYSKKNKCIDNTILYYILRDVLTSETYNISNYKESEKWNIIKLKETTSHLSKLLSHFYYQYFTTHESVIKECYSKMRINTPIDFANYIQQQAPVRPISDQAIIYIFDSITKTTNKIERDISDYEPGKKWRTKVLNEIFNI